MYIHVIKLFDLFNKMAQFAITRAIFDTHIAFFILAIITFHVLLTLPAIIEIHFPRHTWKIVDSTNYLCNCVNKASIKDVICEILEWGSRMWLRLKIIYLIISLSLSHPLSNLATTYYMCPDANFAIDRWISRIYSQICRRSLYRSISFLLFARLFVDEENY